MRRDGTDNPLTENEIIQILDPKGDISKVEFKIRRKMYDKYPRPLSKKEKERMEEQKEEEELEAEFQKLYGLSDDDNT